MIQFGRLLSFPLAFRHLEDKIKDVKIDKLQAKKINDNQIYIDAAANGHAVQFMIYDSKLEVSSRVQIQCDCKFFTYNLAFGLHQHTSLLHPESFVLVPPKSKNTSLVLSGCKHVIKVAREIYARKALIVV